MSTAFVIPETRDRGHVFEWETPEQVEALVLGELGAEEVITVGPIRTPYGKIMLWAGARLEGKQPNAVAEYVGEISSYPTVLHGPIAVTGWTDDNAPAPLSEDTRDALYGMTQAYVDGGAKFVQDAPERMMKMIHAEILAAVDAGDSARLQRVLVILREIHPKAADYVTLIASMGGLL
jgi:hypothetical protein